MIKSVHYFHPNYGDVMWKKSTSPIVDQLHDTLLLLQFTSVVYGRGTCVTDAAASNSTHSQWTCDLELGLRKAKQVNYQCCANTPACAI